MFRVTQFEPKTLRWWFSQRSKIDLNPPYQRHGRLWSTTDKAFLVDSIVNEYDVPKIYIADFTFGHTQLNTQGLPYAIIDGKQRLVVSARNNETYASVVRIGFHENSSGHQLE